MASRREKKTKVTKGKVVNDWPWHLKAGKRLTQHF